ncbi:MAG: M14 family metallopeptidase, partial [Syntrophothermus sp.]
MSLVSAQDSIPKGWATFFEASGYMGTPHYDESIAYFNKLAGNSPFGKMIPIGESSQGRTIYCFIAARNKEFSPEEAHRSGKAVILLNNGIHAGEIEGKDASMILLREILITKEKEYLLDNNIFMVIPVLNVDGHERMSPFNRINQNGPKEMGWRTTAQNINLNRDFMKADAPEMQALLRLFSSWMPDFFIDSHTTDGADYQYSVTYEMEKFGDIYHGTADWIKKIFIPYLENRVQEKGFLIAPYVSFKNDEMKNGIQEWASLPRLSTGYCSVQNRPSLLIETHMLKPYKERVLSTKACVEAVLEYCNNKSRALQVLNAEADQNSEKELTGKYLPVDFAASDKKKTFMFKGYVSSLDSSFIAGETITRYSKEKRTFEIPYYYDVRAKDSVPVATGYIIPREWGILAERMKLHGIEVKEMEKDTILMAERYRFQDVKFPSWPYEGRFQPSFEVTSFNQKVTVPKGSYFIRTDQRTIRVIVNLLEPKAPDSFVKWGFLNSIFEQKEYFEDYSMEPIAEAMLKTDKKL